MYNQPIALIVVCIASVVYTATDKNYRLNTPIVPSAYYLHITPHFETHDDKAFTFDGEVTINFTTTANTNQIRLHSDSLNFTAANITVVNLNSSSNINLSKNNSLEFKTLYSFADINLSIELIPETQYAITITYTGPLRQDLNGFYKVYYLENGVKKWMAATQMEPTYARKTLPCFDEPGLKAVFTLQIVRPSNYKNSLSNTKIESSIDLNNGYTRETFYPTPRMSTYLVAFVVSEFVPGEYRNGSQEFGIYTRPEVKNQSSYAFNLGQEVVEKLSNYFGIDYYSTNKNLKLDHVALPDFEAGAMENWGLITYREAVLLYDPKRSGPNFRFTIARVVTHETTHMWLGNLVTCNWWSNTWLQEGAATYFENYLMAIIEPDMGSANALVTSSLYEAYKADDVSTAVPLSNNNVNSESEVSDQFGDISYEKGASVIRMIHHLIGDDAFKLGLHTYLMNNSFGSGEPDLLYAALDYGVTTYNSMYFYPNVSVADVMPSWVTQAGYPVVHVNINYNTDIVIFTQKRFYNNASCSSDELYKIPVTYTTGISPDFNNTKPIFIVDMKACQFTIPNISQSKAWVLFNIQDTGIYKVNYDEDSWQIIASALKGSDHKKIHHLNRAKIVNDLFAFLYADQIKFTILYDVLEFLLHEDDYSVWIAALNGFQRLISTYIGFDKILPDIKAYLLNLIEPVIGRLGYEERETIDSFEDLRNRHQILEFACQIEHSGCIQHAIDKFKDLKENGTEVYPSLRPVVYSTGVRYGSGDDYDYLWNRLVATNVASEVSDIIKALGSTTNEEKLKSYLVSVTKENSPIRTQDLKKQLQRVLSNHSNCHIVIDSLKSDYAFWNSRFHKMGSVLSSVVDSLRTENEFNEFETFLAACNECKEEDKTSARKSLSEAKAAKVWWETLAKDILSTLRSKSISSRNSP